MGRIEPARVESFDIFAADNLSVDGVFYSAAFVREALNAHDDLKAALEGWIVANGNEDRFRCWGDSGPEWTKDKSKALHFARRKDAEAFARDDEDAWKILSVHKMAPPLPLVEAAKAVADQKFETFKARNGRDVGVQDDRGEKCWIVPFEAMWELERALAALSKLDGGK